MKDPVSENKTGNCPEEQYPRLTSNLYVKMHIYVPTNTHKVPYNNNKKKINIQEAYVTSTDVLFWLLK